MIRKYMYCDPEKICFCRKTRNAKATTVSVYSSRSHERGMYLIVKFLYWTIFGDESLLLKPFIWQSFLSYTDLGRLICNFHCQNLRILVIKNTFKSEIFSKIKASKMTKTADIDLLKLPNLILRKIWGFQMWNFLQYLIFRTSKRIKIAVLYLLIDFL